MPITLFQNNSFNFHSSVDKSFNDKYNIKNMKAIDIILEVIKEKIKHLDSYSSHFYFLEGRTGSGKSTALPVEIFDKLKLSVIITEPKINLTVGNINSILSVPEFGGLLTLGKNIGYKNGLSSISCSEKTGITFITTQILEQKLNKIINEFKNTIKGLKQKEYINLPDVIIVDEVHNLDNPMIQTLYTIKKFMESNLIHNNLKPVFIFQSATIDIDNLIKYFFEGSVDKLYKDPLLIGYVKGQRNFNVETKYDDVKNMNEFYEKLKNDYIPMSLNSNSIVKYSNFEFTARDILIFCQGISFYTKLCNVFLNDNEDVKKMRQEGIIRIPKMMKMKNTNKVKDVNEVNKRQNEIENVECENDSNDGYDNYDNEDFITIPYFYTNQADNETTDFNKIQEYRKRYKNQKRLLIIPFMSKFKTYSQKMFEQSRDQDVEALENEIKIIVGTNALEAGKTIDSLYICINNNLRYQILYNPFKNTFGGVKPKIQILPNDESSNIQKNGRVGRRSPGVFVDIISENEHKNLKDVSIVENINIISYSDFFIKSDDKYFDFVKMNNFYIPLSFDSLIITAYDLIHSFNISPFGLNTIHDINALWLYYARFYYYILNWDLLSSLLTARYNRNNYKYINIDDDNEVMNGKDDKNDKNEKDVKSNNGDKGDNKNVKSDKNNKSVKLSKWCYNGIYRIGLNELKSKKTMDYDFIMAIKDATKLYFDIINGKNSFIKIKI